MNANTTIIRISSNLKCSQKFYVHGNVKMWCLPAYWIFFHVECWQLCRLYVYTNVLNTSSWFLFSAIEEHLGAKSTELEGFSTKWQRRFFKEKLFSHHNQIFTKQTKKTFFSHLPVMIRGNISLLRVDDWPSRYRICVGARVLCKRSSRESILALVIVHLFSRCAFLIYDLTGRLVLSLSLPFLWSSWITKDWTRHYPWGVLSSWSPSTLLTERTPREYHALALSFSPTLCLGMKRQKTGSIYISSSV